MTRHLYIVTLRLMRWLKEAHERANRYSTARMVTMHELITRAERAEAECDAALADAREMRRLLLMVSETMRRWDDNDVTHYVDMPSDITSIRAALNKAREEAR